MRTRLKNSAEVCHIWAQQNQAEGRCANVFFDGPSVYSYGHHFEMARFIRPRIVFMTTRTYSNTTARHLSDMRQAVSHIPSYTVPSFSDHSENVRYFMAEIADYLNKTRKSTGQAAHYEGRAGHYCAELTRYLAEFSRNIPAAVRKEGRAALKAAAKCDFTELVALQAVKNRLRDESRDKRRALARAARDYELRGNLEIWRSGAEGRGYLALPHEPLALRLKDGEIQTSRGARIPLNVGLALYERLKAGAAVHGMPLGDYTVTGYAGGVLTVGCHEIPMAEMERLAATLEVKA